MKRVPLAVPYPLFTLLYSPHLSSISSESSQLETEAFVRAANDRCRAKRGFSRNTKQTIQPAVKYRKSRYTPKL